MDYSFNGEIAQIYGVNEAVFIHNLYWWIAKNEANGRHYYDGRNWTYNSMEAFAKLFPFWSKRQIWRIIDKLKNNGAIFIGNYNKKGFDRTQWYALSEDIVRAYQTTVLLPNGNTHITKQSLPCYQTVTPIPDINTDINTDIKENIKEKNCFDDLINKFTENDLLKTTIKNYLQMRKERKKFPTENALELIFKKLSKYDDQTKINMLEKSIVNAWTDVYEIKEDFKKKNNIPKPEDYSSENDFFKG